MADNDDRRTLPQRALAKPEMNVAPLERGASFAAGFTLSALAALSRSLLPRLALGTVGLALLKRAITGQSRIYKTIGYSTRLALPIESSITVTSAQQRTVTIRASMPEIELFLQDPPRIQGYQVGRDLLLDFSMRPGPTTTGTELQARLTQRPPEMTSAQAERLLRETLRTIKQLVEAGEVAVGQPKIQQHEPQLKMQSDALSNAPSDWLAP